MAETATESDGQAVVKDAQTVKLISFNVLQLVKTGQSQHGCRYGDYQRYRRYCFSRLRRLYSSLKFLHGRGKYQKRNLDPSSVNDVRHLHIPLYSAERAWGYAMELKQTEPTVRHFSRKRAHLIRRLTRAAKWADVFCGLCQDKADSKTALEAEAYASYMWGSVLLEKEKDFESALAKFVRARAVYEQLGRVGAVEEQVLCRQRADEMEPSIRFCNYKLGRTDSASMGADLLQLSGSEGPAAELLQSKLEAVMEEARSKQSADLTELDWLGKKLVVMNAKTRLCILKAQQLEAEVASPDATNERRLNLFDKIFVAYHDAKRHVREDLVAAGSAEDVKEQLSALDRAVSGLLLERTMERNVVLVTWARQRLARAEKQAGQEREKGGEKKRARVDESGKSGAEEEEKGEKEREKEKPARAEDLIRLFDTLVQNVTDLTELCSSAQEQSSEEKALIRVLDTRKAAYEASRCVYVGQSYAAAGKNAEAYAVLGLAKTKIEAAMKSIKKEDSEKLQSEKEELQRLMEKSQGQRALMRATAALEAARGPGEAEKGMSGLALKQPKEHKEQAHAPFLLHSLDTFTSVLQPVGSKAPPHITHIPPPFCAMPCRPIVLDTALNAITFPSLAQRTKKEQKKGGSLFSAFWGR